MCRHGDLQKIRTLGATRHSFSGGPERKPREAVERHVPFVNGSASQAAHG